MTNTGRDGRTHRPALIRRCVQGARAPGRHRRDQRSASSAPCAPATSATPRPPPASIRGLRRSEAPGRAPVSLNGGANGPPLQLLPGWPRAPLLRGEPRWRRLWLCEEDGRGGGSGGGKGPPIARSARRLGALGAFGAGGAAAAGAGAHWRRTFEAEELSGATGGGGRARYKEGKHGGGGLRRRWRRGKRLRGDHGGGRSQGSGPRPEFLTRRDRKLLSAARPAPGGQARRARTIAPRHGRRGEEGARARAMRAAARPRGGQRRQ